MAAGIALLALGGNVQRLASKLETSPLDTGRATVFAKAGNAEARLAAGGRIRLRDADVAALELVPRLPVKVAERLARSKEEVLMRAGSLPREERRRAYTIVHGIGPKTAQLLETALSLD